MTNASQSQANSIANRVYGGMYCNTDCKYDKPNGRKVLAYMKRQRAKRTRYKLREALRREA